MTQTNVPNDREKDTISQAGEQNNMQFEHAVVCPKQTPDLYSEPRINNTTLMPDHANKSSSLTLLTQSGSDVVREEQRGRILQLIRVEHTLTPKSR